MLQMFSLSPLLKPKALIILGNGVMGGTIHVTRTAGETEVQPNTKLSRATIYRDKALGLIPVALNIAIRPKSYWIDMK
jgi:hypothetical protein